MNAATCAPPKYAIKEPQNLSPRIQWLRDYYFQGVDRAWNNEWLSWTTGTPWDFQYEELPLTDLSTNGAGAGDCFLADLARALAHLAALCYTGGATTTVYNTEKDYCRAASSVDAALARLGKV